MANMWKPNLYSGSATDIRNFVTAVVKVAIADHEANARRKSGRQLLDLCAGDARKFHAKMATGIYNPTRRSLELMRDYKLQKETPILSNDETGAFDDDDVNNI